MLELILIKMLTYILWLPFDIRAKEGLFFVLVFIKYCDMKARNQNCGTTRYGCC
jgi:uncharacterized membrane protein YobD (UPF0266 family)